MLDQNGEPFLHKEKQKIRKTRLVLQGNLGGVMD
jgi:hypothetical protein